MSDAAQATDEAKFGPFHLAALAVAFIAHAAFIASQWSGAYIDFGDGNYLYIASRIAEGGVVYRDILAPQPPCHLFLGAFLIKASQWLSLDSALYLVRAFSLALHLATALLVVVLARRAWGRATTAVVAGIIFLALPIGMWWSMGYQSEPLEVFFLLLMMVSATGRAKWRDVTTGVFGALAAMTNATAAPFLLALILFMLASNWRRALRVAIPALLLAGAMTAGMELYSDGNFLSNAVFNQAGTFNTEDFWSYSFGKIRSEGWDILYREGFFIVLAVLGFFHLIHESPLEKEDRHGLAWFCFATLGSFVYVIKGGTMDYIFSLAEPAVALLAAGELVAIWGRIHGHRPAGVARRGLFESDEPGPATSGDIFDLVLKGAGLLWVVLLSVAALYNTGNFYRQLWYQTAFELPTLERPLLVRPGDPMPNNVEKVNEWIEEYSEPGDTILAPPFYAFVTGRKIWGDYSELFIWRMKDYNDRVREKNFLGEGWQKTVALADAIERREMPIVIIELDQTGQLPEVIEALRDHYRPLFTEPYRTLNTRLAVFVPLSGEPISP